MITEEESQLKKALKQFKQQKPIKKPEIRPDKKKALA